MAQTVSCPACNGMVSNQAPACPHCGHPMMEKQYEFVEVYFNGSFMSGRGRLDELLANGWKIVDQHDWVECEDGSEFEITKYKLEKTVRSGA